MPPPKSQARSCPLPISTTQLAETLIRLRVRLRGELAKADDDEELLVDRDTAQTMMAHIEPLLAFLAIDFYPKKLKPIRTLPKIGPLSYGDLRVEVLAALRGAIHRHAIPSRRWVVEPQSSAMKVSMTSSSQRCAIASMRLARPSASFPAEATQARSTGSLP